MPSIASIFIFVCFHMTLSNQHFGCARGELTQIVNVSKQYASWTGRLHSVSTESPVTNAIRADESGDLKFRRAFDLLDGLSSEATRRRLENDSRACNLPPSIRWSSGAKQKPQIYQIGVINEECFSRVDIIEAVKENKLSSNYSRETRNIVRDTRNVIDNATKGVDFYRDGNWTDPKAPYGINTRTYLNERQVCTADTIFAYRVNGSWYIRASATNYPIFKNRPDPERQFLHEFVPVSGTTALQMVQTSRETGELELSSTVTAAWGGTGYAVVPLNFDDMDMPLSMAYNKNLISVDIASDALTPSNVAILALPMAMSLIPVAFVADLNTFGMFAYILVTDVFSTIPFLIKGVELVQSSTVQETVMMYYHAGNETIGNSQVYVIDCHGESVFRNTGIIFITIALAATAVGLLTEIYARHVMQKRRMSLKGDAIQGPFGPAVYEETSHGLLGRDETRIEDEYWHKWKQHTKHGRKLPGTSGVVQRGHSKNEKERARQPWESGDENL